MNAKRALRAINLEATDRIPMFQQLSNPDAEYAITGIDPTAHPEEARVRLHELTHIDVGPMTWNRDASSVEESAVSRLAAPDTGGHDRVRWGGKYTERWDWGESFQGIEEVLAYSPLDHMDLSREDTIEARDYTLSVEELAGQLQERTDRFRRVYGNRCLIVGGFYTTLFMWPLLTFGWEHFLEMGIAHKEECKRILGEFAEMSRKIFRAWALTDVDVVFSHDDICFTAGPVFSPDWLAEMIYPYYEEFWGYLRGAGKKVILMCDGSVDRIADDVFTCGADGIISEPYTDFRAIAEKHPDKVIAGDGDCRTIKRGDREEIFQMVQNMCEWGRRYPGYFLCSGNNIPWDLPVDAVKAFFEAVELYGTR